MARPAGSGKTKSLCDIFNAFADDVNTRFDEIKGRFLLWDMNTFDVYGAQYLDTKRTGLSDATAFDYLSRQQVVQEMDEDETMSSESAQNSRRGLKIIYLNNRVAEDEFNRVSKKTEMSLLLTLDHELGHCVLDGAHNHTGKLDRGIYAESIADAFALIRHYQRFGVNSGYQDKYTSPFMRAHNMIFSSDDYHFTAFVLDEIVKSRHQIDFQKMTLKQTADLARLFTAEYMPPLKIVQDLYEAFKPVRMQARANPTKAVKTLVNMTLNPESDYYVVKLGALWLRHFLEKPEMPNGAQVKLTAEDIAHTKKLVAAREKELDQQRVLFNMPRKNKRGLGA